MSVTELGSFLPFFALSVSVLHTCIFMYLHVHCIYPQLMDYKVKWSESQTELQQQLKGAKKVSQSGTCAQCGGAI